MIVIDPEFKALIPRPSEEERSQLEANLIAEGCRDPLVVWEPDGILIDGHNRYEICKRNKIQFRTVAREFDTREDAKLWVIKNQFGRRNLTPFQRAELALELEPLIAAKARERMLAGKKPDPSQNSDQGEVNTKKEIAKIAGVSHDTIARVKKIKERTDEKVHEKLRDANSKVSINSEFQRVKKQEEAEKKQVELAKAREEISEDKKAKLESVCDIRHCSCKELFASGVKPDVVITDPPYPKEFLECFTELAEGCAAADIPVVAVMSGQSYLPEVYQRLSEHLKYRWTLAYMTPGGQAVQQWQAKVNTAWKPVLLFGESLDWFGDVAVSKPNDNDKRFHHWGQSESGMADLVQRLSKPGQTICDPFLGGGTTATAAIAMGRRFIGCDIDKNHVETVKARLLNGELAD